MPIIDREIVAERVVDRRESQLEIKRHIHVIGQEPRRDVLVFGEGRDKTDISQILISPNGRWLVVRVHMGWDKSEVFVRDLRDSSPTAAFRPVAVGIPALFDPDPHDDRPVKIPF